MLKHYDSLTNALNDLRKRGFHCLFGIKKDHIYCNINDLKLRPAEFVIPETYRFEGSHDPGDSVVVYAIQSLTNEVKGILTIPSAGFSEELSDELIKKFQDSIETPDK